MNIKVVSNINKSIKKLDSMANITADATVTALNRSLYDMRMAERQEVKKVFKNPTPFIQNGIIYDKAKYRKSAVGKLRFKGRLDTGKYPSPEDIMEPHVEGGPRILKRSEQRLRDANILPPNKYITPTPHIKLNKYDNIPYGRMASILSSLGAFNTPGFTANQTATSRKRNKKARSFFTPKDELPQGIWERLRNGGIRPVLWFSKKPRYKKVFKFYRVAEETLKRTYAKHYEEAFQKQLKYIFKK